MKTRSKWCVASFAFFVSTGAYAQTPRQPAVQTAAYTERSVGGDEVVTFTGDELAGITGGPYGDLVRRPPGAVRVGLIRPRMNFVSELLKSVENL